MSELLTPRGIAIPPAQELGQQVLEQLRVLIITGELRPGTHLVESQLSATFDVSRGPVRDALAQLEAEGLVESRRRGSFVVGLEEHDISELYSLRQSLELLAMREATARADADWSLATTALERMREAANEGDYPEFARADLDFHSTFYTIAGHRRLAKVWQQYEPTFAVLLTLTTAEDVDLHPSFDSHAEILTQLQHGQIDEAATTLDEHLLGSRTRLTAAHRRLLGERSDG